MTIQIISLLKSHIIMEHCHQYMELTCQNFSKTSAEAIESSHQRLRDLEMIHGKKTKSHLGTEAHAKRQNWITALFNLMNCGFRTAQVGEKEVEEVTNEMALDEHDYF